MVSGLRGPVRRFQVATVLSGVVLVVFTLLLMPWSSLPVRTAATSVGLVVAGMGSAVGALLRIRRVHGRERRAWSLLAAAGVTAIVGNVWVTVTGSDPVTSPSVFSDLTIAVALAIATVGLLAFPGPRRRGARLVSLLLDGLVASTALLVVVAVLVYGELDGSGLDGRSVGGVLAVVIPLLDVALATVALLLIVRAPRSQRVTFSLVAAGFLLYAVADLTYAVRMSRGTFEFGSLLDLGWILGYLLFGLAAWVPERPAGDPDRPDRGLSEARGTMVVFAVLLVAALVQIGFGPSSGPVGVQGAAWIVLVLAAGARQVLLAVDNTRLRRGLERRVEDQTQDLRRLAHQNALLLESVGDGIYGVDRDGLITFLNASASSLLGWSLAEVAGRRAHDLFRAPDSTTGLPTWEHSRLARAMRDQAVETNDHEVYRRADGTTFPVELTAAPVVEDQRVLGAVVVFRDVTQRREVDRIKNEFLSVVSHELRTPLTSIRASLELIEGGHLGVVPPGASSLVTVALESSERLTRLINDLLDVERIESGDQPMQIEALPARQLLGACVEQITGLARSVGVEVRVGAASGTILGDRDQVLQTLLNLVGNACKFSPAGSTVVLEAEPDGAWVTFRVRDQGRGIPPDKLESVFERFGQVDSSDTRLHGGTGLGLAICRGIVHRHGGTIRADSVLGVGTTVSFTLPRARRRGVATDAHAQTAPYPAARPSPYDSVVATAVDREAATGPTVLVCDDDPVVVAAFSAALAGHGFQPVGVTDGSQVSEVLASRSPDLVLLDLLMPGTTGAEVLAALRADPAHAVTPVVVVSGLGPESDPVVAAAAEKWLVKPVSEQRLVETVTRTLGLGQGAGSATVLLIEDDLAMGEVLSTRLSLEGLRVVRARTASEAVQLGRGPAPDLVVLDMALPDGTGHDVVSALRLRRSLARVPLVVYSAQEVEPSGRGQLRLGETRYLEKSRTSPAELVTQVLELVQAATGPTSGLITGPTPGPHRTDLSSTIDPIDPGGRTGRGRAGSSTDEPNDPGGTRGGASRA